MSTMTIEALLDLVGEDRELLEVLGTLGVIPKDAQIYNPEEVESVLVSRTLVRELEVNWAGVEVILRMRRQLLVTRLRLAEVRNRETDSQ